ncbi:MAG: site-specific integrase, partial [Halapricum sp.]
MTPRERPDRSLASSFERDLQDKGRGRGGDGGNYRRDAARELECFAEW